MELARRCFEYYEYSRVTAPVPDDICSELAVRIGVAEGHYFDEQVVAAEAHHLRLKVALIVDHNRNSCGTNQVVSGWLGSCVMGMTHNTLGRKIDRYAGDELLAWCGNLPSGVSNANEVDWEEVLDALIVEVGLYGKRVKHLCNRLLETAVVVWPPPPHSQTSRSAPICYPGCSRFLQGHRSQDAPIPWVVVTAQSRFWLELAHGTIGSYPLENHESSRFLSIDGMKSGVSENTVEVAGVVVG